MAQGSHHGEMMHSCKFLPQFQLNDNPYIQMGRTTLLSSYSCKCITVRVWFPGFFLYSQTHAVYTLCKIVNVIPFTHIYVINQSPDLINTLQYKIARYGT